MQEQDHDVVIIGGGLGGLLCAVMLAKEGKKVCLLEKNRQIGDCLQTFALHKKVFDACVHYIGGLGEGHTLHQIFRYAGILDDLPIHELDPHGFDHIIFGDEEESYPLPTRTHFVETLLPHFPGKRDALQDYLSVISDVASKFPLYNLRNGDPSDKLSVFSMELMSTLRTITKDERLAQVLAGNNLLYAGVEGVTPFYVHAMSTEGYLHSTHKAVPGSSRIAKLLWRELQRHGSELHRYADVNLLHEEGGTIQYAQTSDGQRWYAKDFIAAIHPAVLFSMTDSKALRPIFRERISSLPSTPPGLMVNLVLRPGTIPYPNHNIYWHPSGQALARVTSTGIEWPDTQALFFNEDASLPGFAESLTILVYATDDAFADWQASENITGVHIRRTEAYHEKKEAYADDILSKTFTRFPGLKDAILARSVATPLTIRDYTGTPGGSLYGPLKDVSRPAHTSLTIRTKIPNLYMTGQNVNMHGVMGVSISAVASCGELLGMDYLLSRIHKA
jgi:all-trans-retinol 13,14-reductase